MPSNTKSASPLSLGLLFLCALASMALQNWADLGFGLGWPAYLPAAFTPVLSLATIILLVMRKSRFRFFTILIFFAINLVTFPWWLQEWPVWILYVLFSSGITLFFVSVPRDLNPWQTVIHRGLLTTTAGMVLLGTSSLAHLSAMLVAAIPVALIAAIMAIKKTNWMRDAGDFWLLTAIGLLIINGSIRFVPDSEASIPEKPLILLAAFIYLLWGSLHQRFFRLDWKYTLLGPVLAAILSMTVYTLNMSPPEASSDYDYASQP